MKARDANDIAREGGPEALRHAYDDAMYEIPEADADHMNGAGATQVNGAGVHRGKPIRILSAAEFVAGLAPPAYAIDGVMQSGYTYALTGKTGHGKTAVALAIGASVALGRPIGDREVTQGDILYLAGENADDVRARVVLQCDALGVKVADLPMFFIGDRFSIDDAIPTLQREIKRLSRPLGMIIVDTTQAFFPGDDENANSQMAAYAFSLRQLGRDAPGRPCTVTLTHPIKSADKDRLLPRGGGAFLAEIDGNLTLWSSAPGTAELHWQGKHRGPSFEPLHWSLDRRTSPHLVDSKGRQMPGVIASLMNEDAQQKMVAAARSDEDSLLENILSFPNSSFAERCRTMGWLSSKGEPLKSRLARVADDLIADRLLKRERGNLVLTDKGRREAEKSVVRGSK